MGKVRRAEIKQQHKREEFQELSRHIDRLNHLSRTLAIAATVLAVLAVAFQCFLIGLMYYNLDAGVYVQMQNTSEDISTLTTVLPLGIISLVMMMFGMVLTSLFIYRKKPGLSLIGCGAIALGIAFFVFYVCQLAALFPWRPEAGFDGVGLNFAALLYQHYSSLLPFVLLIPCEIFAFRAAQKRAVADVMQGAMNSTVTIALDDGDDIATL